MTQLNRDKNRRVLVIDDNRSIHDDFRKILSPATATAAAAAATERAVFFGAKDTVEQTQFEVDSAYQGQEGVLLAQKALQAWSPYAMAFVDVRMPPGWDGVETTRRLWELDPNLQVVLCTAYSDYSWGEMFEKLGGRDGLLILKKPFDAVEALQLAQALTEKWWLHQQIQRRMEGLETRVSERTRELQESNRALQTKVAQHQRAEETLRESEQQLRVQTTALDAAANAIMITDHNGTIQSVNPAFTALTGYTAQEAVGKTPRILKSGQQDEASYRNLWQTISSGQVWSGEMTNRRKDGSLYTEEMTVTPLRNGNGVIARYIAIKQDISDRKQAEEVLRQSEEQFRAMFDLASVGIAQADPRTGQWVRVNRKMCDITGYSAGELLRMHVADITHPEDRLSDRESFERVVRGEAPDYRMEKRYIRKDGVLAWVNVNMTVIRDAAGQPTRTMAAIEDISERKRIEAHLFQSQKMETVGKLAGGIAHEFNSIMTAIIGQSELMLYDLPAGNPLRKNTAEIHQAADRAATLTRQLLAYGRKQILQPEVLDLNTVLAGMENTLRHLAGRDVDVHIAPSSGPKLVKADPGQIEQVIVNIVMNAADAMPHGGKLTLETGETFLDQEYVSQFHDLKAGEYVMLAITDTGAGMSQAVKARIFEPFFTTKGVGQGTGLGLATCHGIIKQSGGHIIVYSEPGRGATFKIYLPKAQSEKKSPAPPLQSPSLPRGTETILLVEDDPALREMAAELLGRLGYTVLTAGDGLEALNVTNQHATGHIDLLFTDVVMPHMSGKELADRVRALYPHTKILFTSAYTENAIVHQGMLNPGITLLQKPFTPSALAHKVREVLDHLKTPEN